LVYLWQFGIFMTIWYIYDNLVYLWQFGIFMTIWYIYDNLVYLCILYPLGIFYGYLVYFSRFG
jgi:hypothetical protein